MRKPRSGFRISAFLEIIKSQIKKEVTNMKRKAKFRQFLSGMMAIPFSPLFYLR